MDHVTSAQHSDRPGAAPFGALAGARVIDLSRVLAGPACAQTLGDHGATVVKVEPPQGDETRTWGPPWLPDGSSAYFTALNRNKRNICLDLTTPGGREILLRLLESADVLVENFRAGTMARWGLDYDTVLADRFPSLVYCRVTGYGVDGPLGGLPGYDAVLQAFSGLMSVNGEADGPPLRLGVPIVDMVAAQHAVNGILLALFERVSSGRGQLVDSCLLDSAVSLLHPHSAAWLADGKVPERTGSAHPSIAPYEVFQTAAGPMFLAVGNDRQFAALVDVLGCPELACDPRFRTNADRVVNVAELRRVLGGLIESADPAALAQSLLERRVPATPVHDIAQALTHPQVHHRQMVARVDDYEGAGVPVKLSRTPGKVRTGPGHQGRDTVEVLQDAGYSEDEIAAFLRSAVAVAVPQQEHVAQDTSAR